MSATAIDHYLSQFSRSTADTDVQWLLEQKSTAARLLSENGFPTRKVEDWRYTDIKPILKRNFTFNQAKNRSVNETVVSAARITDLDCHELVFINGKFSPEHSKIENLLETITIKPLAEEVEENNNWLQQHLNNNVCMSRNGFVALNTAFIRDGSVVRLLDNTTVGKPINLIYLSDTNEDAAAYNLRNLIVLGKNSHASIIETYFGSNDKEYFTNTITEACLNEGASLQHYKLQQEGTRGFHVGYLHVDQSKDSRFESHSISLGGILVRSDLDICLHGPGAESSLYGLYMADNNQHIDNHTRVDHSSPHTSSSEIYHGVLNGHARGVFNGKIIVHKDAQKTDAHLSNENLLLSNDAEVDTKPELEIYADDVKCSHGATVGRLDEDMLFYLRTRAIREDIAKSLLTFAFAEDVISQIRIPEIRKRLEQTIIGKLPDTELIKEFLL